MKSKHQIQRIVSARLSRNRTATFRFVPEGENTKTIALLASAGTSFSMSLSNGTEMEILTYQIPDFSLRTAPDKQKIIWRQDLKDTRAIVGSITNDLNINRTVSLYLITIQNNTL